MNNSAYKTELNKIKSDIEKRGKELKDIGSDFYRTFLTCRANVQNFLPEYEINDPVDFYKDVIYYRDWAELDQRSPFAFENIRVRGNKQVLSEAAQKPHIFCTFHLGSYRMINYLMVKNNAHVTLVVADSIFEDVSKEFDFMHKQYNQKNDLQSDFKVLNAEKGNIGLQMIKDLKRGRNLMIYIDGNTGAGDGLQDDKLVKINFLNQKINARKGVAFLSHLLNIPIIPVIAYRDDKLSPIVELYPAIYPDKDQNRDAYCKETTQFLFDEFSKHLKKVPEQWEAWQYVHQFLAPAEQQGSDLALQANEIYYFNKQRFSFFKKEGDTYLFDAKTYNSFKISQNLSGLLAKTIDIKASGDEWKDFFNVSLFQNFVNNQIFTKQGAH